MMSRGPTCGECVLRNPTAVRDPWRFLALAGVDESREKWCPRHRSSPAKHRFSENDASPTRSAINSRPGYPISARCRFPPVTKNAPTARSSGQRPTFHVFIRSCVEARLRISAAGSSPNKRSSRVLRPPLTTDFAFPPARQPAHHCRPTKRTNPPTPPAPAKLALEGPGGPPASKPPAHVDRPPSTKSTGARKTPSQHAYTSSSSPQAILFEPEDDASHGRRAGDTCPSDRRAGTSPVPLNGPTERLQKKKNRKHLEHHLHFRLS